MISSDIKDDNVVIEALDKSIVLNTTLMKVLLGEQVDKEYILELLDATSLASGKALQIMRKRNLAYKEALHATAK